VREAHIQANRLLACDTPAVRCSLVIHQLFAAPGRKISSLHVGSAAFIFVHHILSKRRKQRKKKTMVVNGVLQKISVQSGTKYEGGYHIQNSYSS
jgi:hypothetical protein